MVKGNGGGLWSRVWCEAPFFRLQKATFWSQELFIYRPSQLHREHTPWLPFSSHGTIRTHKPSISYQVPTYSWVERVNVCAKSMPCLGAQCLSIIHPSQRSNPRYLACKSRTLHWARTSHAHYMWLLFSHHTKYDHFQWPNSCDKSQDDSRQQQTQWSLAVRFSDLSLMYTLKRHLCFDEGALDAEAPSILTGIGLRCKNCYVQ